MAEYCTTTDITNRLTQIGLLNVADRNNDKVVDPTEEAAYVTPAIEYGGNVIDGYLCGQLVPDAARGAANPWLRDRCIDIAVMQLCMIGGRDAPKSVSSARDFTMDLLKRVMDGARIPGYPYPGPANARFIHHGPKVANFGRDQRRIGNQSRGNWPYY